MSIFASALRLASCLTAALVLASCGGETTQIEPFEPTRVIAFGDEMSAFTADGRKYTVNALSADGTAIDCNSNPLWIQIVARLYGFGFPECPLGEGEQKALTRAQPGAKATTLEQQVDAQIAAGGFTATDLVLVLVGVNDIKELYERYPAESQEVLVAIARERGIEIGKQVNRIAKLGARVIVSTTPDISLSPYGIAQGADGAVPLSNLVAALNGRIRVTIINDGRMIGLVLADEAVAVVVDSPASYGFTNVTQPACRLAFPPPICTSATLITGLDGVEANGVTWLWADELFLSPGGHTRLGDGAVARALGNPF